MAKQRSIGGIYASLTLRDGGFKKGLTTAGKKLKEFSATSAKYAAVGASAMAAAGGAALLAGTTKTLAAMDDLGDSAAQTGVAIGDMMKLQQAYKDGGREASMAGKDIGKMQKAIVEAAAGGDDPFKALGLSATELLKQNPARQFDMIGEAIMRISNPAERTAKAMQIFGKGGMGLTTVFEGLPAATKALGRMPELAQKFGAAMGEANDLIGHLPLKSDQFFTGFTAGVIGELLPNLEKIDKFDFTTIGENLGQNLAKSLYFIQDSGTWSGIADIAYGAFVSLGEKIGHFFASIINAIADEFNNAFDPSGNKTLLAIKALGRDVFSLGASPEDRASALATNRKEWEESQKFDRPTFEDNFFKRLGQVPEKGSSASYLTDSGNEKIADAWAKATQTVNQNLSSAADRSAKPTIENPIEDLAAKAAAAAAKTPEKMDVNDYQRRGLWLKGGVVSRKEDKQISIMEKMEAHLKTIAASKPSAAF